MIPSILHLMDADDRPENEPELIELMKRDMARLERENDRLRIAAGIASYALRGAARKLNHLLPHYKDRSGREIYLAATDALRAADGLDEARGNV